MPDPRSRIQKLIQDSHTVEALDEGLREITRLGVQLPPAENRKSWEALIEGAVLRIADRMADMPVDALADLPTMKDPRAIAELSLLAVIAPVASHHPHINAWCRTRMLELCLVHGNGPHAALAYVWHGALCAEGGDPRMGQTLADAATALAAQQGDAGQSAMLLSLRSALIDHWLKPLGEVMEQLDEAAELALAAGHPEYAGWSVNHAAYALLYSGAPLDQVHRRIRTALGTLDPASPNLVSEDALLVAEHTVESLLGEDTVNSGREIARRRARMDAHPVTFVFTRTPQLILARLLAAAPEVDLQLEAIAPFRSATAGFFCEGEIALAEGLALADRFEGADSVRREAIADKLMRIAERSRLWSLHAPQTHAPRAHLLESERIQISGHDPRGSYRAAARAAAHCGNLHHEALAWERSVGFSKGRGHDREARRRLDRAIDAYRRWGAVAKVEALSAAG